MGIALCHRAGFVTKQPLDLVQIDPSLDKSRGECVPNVVKAKIGDSVDGAACAILAFHHHESSACEIYILPLQG